MHLSKKFKYVPVYQKGSAGVGVSVTVCVAAHACTWDMLIYTHMHTQRRTHAHTYTYMHMHTHTHTLIHTRTHQNILHESRRSYIGICVAVPVFVTLVVVYKNNRLFEHLFGYVKKRPVSSSYARLARLNLSPSSSCDALFCRICFVRRKIYQE